MMYQRLVTPEFSHAKPVKETARHSNHTLCVHQPRLLRENFKTCLNMDTHSVPRRKTSSRDTSLHNLLWMFTDGMKTSWWIRCSHLCQQLMENSKAQWHSFAERPMWSTLRTCPNWKICHNVCRTWSPNLVPQTGSQLTILVITRSFLPQHGAKNTCSCEVSFCNCCTCRLNGWYLQIELCSSSPQHIDLAYEQHCPIHHHCRVQGPWIVRHQLWKFFGEDIFECICKGIFTQIEIWTTPSGTASPNTRSTRSTIIIWIPFPSSQIWSTGPTTIVQFWCPSWKRWRTIQHLSQRSWRIIHFPSWRRWRII